MTERKTMAYLLWRIDTFLKLIGCICCLPFIFIHGAKVLYHIIFGGNERNIKGATVMITGAANGLGKEMAKQMAVMGCHVLCVDMKKEDLNETVKMINSLPRLTGSAKAYVCDVSDRFQVLELKESVLKENKYIDILVNNAGVIYGGELDTLDDDMLQRVVNVNLLSVCWVTKAFFPSMKERGSGQVVFMSSMAALCYNRKSPIYSMTKAGMAGLAMCLRHELDQNPKWKNIGITTIYPYFIKSNDVVKSINESYPKIEIEDGVGAIITGIRRNYLEFSVPGNDVMAGIMQMIRALPYPFFSKIQDLFTYDVDVKPYDFYKLYVSSTSNEPIYKAFYRGNPDALKENNIN